MSPKSAHFFILQKLLHTTHSSVRNKVDEKIKELVEHDIIEGVDGPTPWLNPVVIVPKSNGSDIRLCIDMRRANEALVRGRYPIPTVTQVILDADPAALGAVFVQKHGDSLVPVYYASRGLTGYEQRYSQTEKEALALV